MMSKLTQLIFALFAFMQCCMVSASSVSLKQVELRVNGTDGTTLQLSDIDPTYGDELNVPVSLFDSLQLSFVSAGPLDQVHLLVGVPAERLEASYYPAKKYIEADSSYLYTFEVSLPKLSDHLKCKPELIATLLASDTETSVFKEIFTLGISDPLEADKSLVKRSFAQPEIRYTFQAPPNTVPAFVAQLFSLVIAFMSLFLIAVWLSADLVCFNLRSLYAYSFVAILLALEFKFYEYYVRASIFTTLKAVFLLGLPALYFGSKTLKLFQLNSS